MVIFSYARCIIGHGIRGISWLNLIEDVDSVVGSLCKVENGLIGRGTVVQRLVSTVSCPKVPRPLSTTTILPFSQPLPSPKWWASSHSLIAIMKDCSLPLMQCFLHTYATSLIMQSYGLAVPRISAILIAVSRFDACSPSLGNAAH